MPWYCYKGGHPCDPNSYMLRGNTPPNCGNPKDYLCAIQAADNSGKPIITPALCAEIAAALQNKVESANVKLKPTPSSPCV